MIIGNSISPFGNKKFFGGGYDPDALAYFDANTAITLSADKSVINDFYLGLKTDSIYSKIGAMWLPIWLTETACKWNLVNPVDSDAAHRLTYHGGYTLTAGGFNGNGSTGYLNTHFNPATSLSNYDNHMSIYSRTESAGNIIDFGAVDSASKYFRNGLRWSNGINYYQYNSVGTTPALAKSKAFYIGVCRDIGNNGGLNDGREYYQDGVSVATSATTDALGGLISLDCFIGASSFNGTAELYSSRQYPFISYGQAFTDAEAANFNTRVTTLLTHFGIQN